MTQRERFFKTMRREVEGYVPFHFSLCPSLISEFSGRTGEQDYLSYYDAPIRFFQAEPRLDRKSVSYGVVYNEWGVGHSKGDFEHYSTILHPMADFCGLQDFKKYDYPNPEADYDWASFAQQVETTKASDLVVFAAMAMTVFEIAWYMRGLDNVLVDMITQPNLASYYLDRVTEVRVECARRYALEGADVLHLGDDIGTQRGMIMSPELWRKFLKPRLKRVIDAAKGANKQLLVDYHSDGNISDVIPELIDIGIDILDPIQPECMDPIEVKERYGDSLSFRGTIGTQTTMPFGSVDDVETTCRQMIENVGRGGGLILAPTHMLQPEVPWENIETFVNVAREYTKV